ncbi:hypothetical protein SAMN05428949_5277 [Chitinophaga sp. YR627]|uniref:DUF6882 domain-containing protein n=1 Tax=Chitinophaga sp. YR627 TaxID=1881041 RepID=UPI0008F2A919|nr:DUF6882 domain-containing protein [Chitinophaga sp. YR627]SFO46821.1 hypothetical protein SAMN05428949_5277 [Chitinophaga sp. YR627]
MSPSKKNKKVSASVAIDYSSFADKCVEELKVLQDNLTNEYDLDWYENWFYNHATGLLTFSTGDKELNFRYFDVGSYSERSKTWKWSWDNTSTPDEIKEKTQLVRSFGERSNFPKLITGQFESNEAESWEFAAIATKLSNGIGVYRPVNDKQLMIFLVITEFVDNETAKNIKDRYVKCSTHEYRRRAFVCRHLNATTKVGFEEAFETVEGMELLEDDDFQAWCNECEAVRLQEGEWNDKSMAFARIKVVCEKCYFEMKALNLNTDI